MNKSFLVLFLSATLSCFAAEVKVDNAKANASKAQKNYLEGISVQAVGAYRQAEFTHGPSEWGAGIDIGLPVNRFVSIHVRNLGFESEGREGKCEEKDTWRGSVVDETAVLGHADFVKLYQEKLKLYGEGGVTRSWSAEDWGFGIGLGASYNFTKNVSLRAGREIRAWFNDGHERDWLSTVSLGWTF